MMTKVDYAELAARLAPFLVGYIGPSTVAGSPYFPAPPPFGIRLVRSGTGVIEWFPATGEGFFDANDASSDGDTILVPAGTYTFTERFIAQSNISIIGEDMELCIIETNFIPNLANVNLYKGGLFQGFTINSVWAGSGPSGTGSVLNAVGNDEDTNTLINVPYVRDVTINMTIASGATGINAFTYALWWHWRQGSIFNDLDKTGPIVVIKDVYINVVDYRTTTYAMNGAAGIVNGRLLTVIADNLNVQVNNLTGHSMGIEFEPSYDRTSFWEARNCSVDVECASATRNIMGWFIIDCNMYKCRTHVVGSSSYPVFGVEVNGGDTIIKDCDFYAQQNGSGDCYGISNYFSYSLSIINCNVVAV